MLDRAHRAVNAARELFGRRALVWGALLAALALVLDFVPLCDVLGYDFCFAIGLGAALAGVDIGHAAVGRARRARGRPERGLDVARIFGEACALALATLVLPLVLSLANAARVRNCSLPAGLGFFVLLPVATVLYAAPAGVVAGLAASSPRRGRALAFALPLGSILWTLLRLYRDPPVFALDPFGGYFPGPIYDEALRPPLTLLLFRVACMVWVSAAVVFTLAAAGRGRDPRRWRRGPRAATMPLVAASITLYALGGVLGFHVQHADLEHTLDRTFATPHFLVHYAAGTKTPAELALGGEDLEFRYQQLRETLGVEATGPITLWDFPNAEVKKQLVGAGHTLYAKPWTREMFMQGERFPSMRLRHEMAHVFAGGFGDPIFGVSLAWRFWGPIPHPVLAMGLVEGIAEAADAGDPEGDATIHQEAAAMIAAGLAPPLAAVVGAGFSALAGARAYTIAGSFSAFLLATRGADRLRALYRSAGDFSDVYRTPLADLEREWRQFLARQPLTTSQRAQASEEFRRPAIFGRVCARELGARIAEARGVLRSDPARAVTLLQSTCRDDPGEPLYQLALAQAEAAAGDPGAARAVLAHLELDADLTRPLRAAAEGLAAEIDFAARDFGNAEAHQRRAAELATTEAERRLAFAKLKGLASPGARGTLGRALLVDDLAASETDPVLIFFLFLEYSRLYPTERLGPYLIGRQLLGRDPARALPQLSRACGDEGASAAVSSEDLPAEVERECRRMIADAAYRVGDFARARAALARLAADATEADRLRALDMRARVDWAAGQREGPVGATSGPP
jgi:plasmid stabilization system protein ParE